MAKVTFVGGFEHLVLLAIRRLGDQAYGMRIRREIEDRAGRPVAIGAVYATLQRLEEKGLVTPRMGKPLKVRGGRARRYYEIAADGIVALRETHSMFERMKENLNEREEFA
jgi:DNA-binding PadR family transcriptional regulator